MLFTIHSAECENITGLYINVSDKMKENLYTCSLNEQVFTVRKKPNCSMVNHSMKEEMETES